MRPQAVPVISSQAPTADGPSTAPPLAVPARIIVILLALAPLPLAVPSGYGLLWIVSYASVGVLLTIRRPGNPIGWVLLGLGWTLALLSGEMDVTPGQFTDGSLSLPQMGMAWLLNASAMPAFTLFAALMAIFPTGRFPGGRWGVALRAAIGVDIVMSALMAFAPLANVNMPGYPDGALVPNPFAIAPESVIWDVVAMVPTFLVAIGILVLAAVSLIARYRHSVGVERAQMRWMATAVGTLIVALLGGLVGRGIFADSVGGAAWVPSILAFAALPVAIGIAVLRYRLYEIDRIISRTIGWGLTTGLVALVFGLLIVGLQALLAPVTNASTLVVAGSTLVAAALVMPLHRRLQAAVDRRFNRARVDAQHALETFGNQLREEVDLDSVSSHLVGIAARTVQPQAIGLWTRHGGASG
jgi:hypothetical protein